MEQAINTNVKLFRINSKETRAEICLKEEKLPEQTQNLPGKESEMNPVSEIIRDTYNGSDKLKVKVALITGGDSGIGRAIAFILPGKELILPLYILKMLS